MDAKGVRVFRKFTTACRIEGAHTALYPFGHGLSYTRFEYSDLQVNKLQLRGAADVLQVRVTLHNAGKCAGTEIVQLYVSDPVASRSRPLRELKDFRRIELAAGESRIVEFALDRAALSFCRGAAIEQPDVVFEPGSFAVHIGGSSVTQLSVAFEWLDA